ncbi:translation elongation factor Ts [Leptospirillum ferriphilum]|jgi:elongation factor Ts|uniref:translation elongation factor Ts n=1 Tax=Leptospirillum ferriphilum TaxID=178606 RepID=UPI001E452744|nr:translation elongation factor Ts [Leptospirillum ferriphilum]
MNGNWEKSRKGDSGLDVSAQLVKELREKTQAGFMECRKALLEAGGDIEKAFEVLKQKGSLQAQKKSDRMTSEGIVSSYIHAGNKIGVLVEVNCETDFVARTEDFRELVKNLAMHIAASSPSYVEKKDIPQDVMDTARKKFEEEVQDKPEKVRGQIVQGKLDKFMQEKCLLDQPYVKDPGILVKDLVAAAIAKLGENITVNRFSRFQIGEGND